MNNKQEDTLVTLFQTFHKYYQHDEWQNNGTTYENNVITPCVLVENTTKNERISTENVSFVCCDGSNFMCSSMHGIYRNHVSDIFFHSLLLFKNRNLAYLYM